MKIVQIEEEFTKEELRDEITTKNFHDVENINSNKIEITYIWNNKEKNKSAAHIQVSPAVYTRIMEDSQKL